MSSFTLRPPVSSPAFPLIPTPMQVVTQSIQENHAPLPPEKRQRVGDPNEVLFKLRRNHLQTGMRGIPVGYCTTSEVRPSEGVFYVDHAIRELVDRDPEDVIYLLFQKWVGRPADLAAFKTNLSERLVTMNDLVDEILSDNNEHPPLVLLSRAIQTLGLKIGTGDYKEDSLNLIANLPQLAALVIHNHANLGLPNPPKPEAGYIGSFLQQLNIPTESEAEEMKDQVGEMPEVVFLGGDDEEMEMDDAEREEVMQAFKQMIAAAGGLPGMAEVPPPGLILPDSFNQKHLERVLKTFNILHYDHGGGNLSARTSKGVASGLGDVYQSVAAGLLALNTPRHGTASKHAAALVDEVLETYGADVKTWQLKDYLQERLANAGEADRLVYGFGHAVLKVEDPRATKLYEMAEKLFPEDPRVKVALQLRNAIPELLRELKPGITNPYPNVDAISGVILNAAGLNAKYGDVLFGMSRGVGIALQILWERTEARDGKGLPLERPSTEYLPPDKKA